MPPTPESFSDLSKTLFLGRLDLTVASPSGKQVENPRIARFRDNPRYKFQNPEKDYKDEIDTLKASGCLVDKYGNRVDKEHDSNRIFSHVLYQIKEVTGKDIVPQTKDFTVAADLAKRIIKFSHECKLTASREDVDMAAFVTDLLKEVGWEGMGAGKEKIKPIAPPREIVETVQKKKAILKFGGKRTLVEPSQGAARAINSTFITHALVDSLISMGINLPFNGDEMPGGVMPLEAKYYPANGLRTPDGKIPIIWIEYRSTKGEIRPNRFGVAQFQNYIYTINNYKQLMAMKPQIEGERQGQFISQLHFHIRNDIAQNMKDPASVAPDILRETARNIAYYFSPNYNKSLDNMMKNTEFTIPRQALPG